MRTTLGAAAGVGPALWSLGAVAATQPNIVLIMADDLGYSDLGCYGSEIATPNLDRLAAGGLRFTQFYNAARCCPSRAALMTGLYPHQTGIGHMSRDFGLPSYKGHIGGQCVTIAEALRAGGYTTLMSGKWHLGGAAGQLPVDRGFDDSFVSLEGGRNYFHPPDLVVNDKRLPTPERNFYMTDAITDHSVGLLDRHAAKGKPFFLYAAYTAPHFPLHALPEDIEKYKGRYAVGWDEIRQRRHGRMVEMGLVQRRWSLSPRHPDAPAWQDAGDKELWDLKMAVYAAQVDRMDQGIGRILEKLRVLGCESNTLVLFVSDNGGCAEHKDPGPAGDAPGRPRYFGTYGLPWANASNTPFRLFKHWAHEGGIATPLIAHWPDRIRKGGGITHSVGHFIDVMATCLDVAGIRYPAEHRGERIVPLEGRSLLPVLEGRKRQGQEALFWEHEGNRAIRQGEWKLVAGHGESWSLYDLEADRCETTDAASRNPAVVARLDRLYRAWAERCGVVPWTDEWEKSYGIPV